MFAGKKSAQIREILISESAWEEMTCLFAPSLANWSLSGLQEHKWNPGFLQLAMRNNAALVPIHITGANSKIYYLTATFWRQLSNMMVIREALRHHGKTMKINIGQQIALSSFKE